MGGGKQWDNLIPEYSTFYLTPFQKQWVINNTWTAQWVQLRKLLIRLTIGHTLQVIH